MKRIGLEELGLGLCLAGLLLASQTEATAAIVYATDATGGAYYEPPSGTVGSVFTVSSQVTVTWAGVFDWGSDGLLGSHDVGVWNSSGALLDTATVAAGTVDPLINGFRWTTLAHALTLTPGTTYVVGAYYGGAGDNDYFVPQATINSPFIYIDDADSNPTGNLAPTALEFPTGNDDSAYGVTGWWGPNLAGPVVPEPTTIISGVLLLLPFGASTLRILRRRQVA